MPVHYIIGGPNGAGKSSFAKRVFPSGRYINGDEIIARARAKNKHVDLMQIQKGIENLKLSFYDQKLNFGTESNLVFPIEYSDIPISKKKGFKTHLVYFVVDSLDKLNQRVLNRKDLGGHYIEPEYVKLRMLESFRLLPKFVHKFDQVTFLNNSIQQTSTDKIQIEYQPLFESKGSKIFFKSDSIPEIIQPTLRQVERAILKRDKGLQM